MNISNQISFFSYLVTSIPFLLISGPFLTDLVISITTIWFLVIIIRDKKLFNYFISQKYNKLIILLLIVLFFSSLLSEYKVYSLKNSLFLFRFLIFSLAVYYLCSKNPKLLEYLFKILLVTFVVLIADSFFQYFFNINFFGMEKKNWSRLSGLFGDEYILGGYLSRFTLLFFGLYFYLRPKINKNVILIIFILIFILVFLSGDRAAFAVMILNSIIIYFFLEIKIKIKIISIFFILISMTFLTLENNKFKQRIFGTLKQIQINKYMIIGTDSHHKLQEIGIDIFKKNLILGVGPKLFRKHCDNYNFYNDFNCENHPHNYFVQGMAEGGVLTLIIFTYFYILIFKLLISELKKIKKKKK